MGFFALISASSVSAADLQVSQYSVAPDPIASSAQATFTITAANNSATAVPNAVVIIAVPSNFEVINAPGNFPAYCTLTGTVGSQTLTCNLPNLIGGPANAQTFTYNAIARTPGSASTTATISALGNVDNNAGNDSLTITPTVRGGADLSVAKSGSAPSVIAGGILQYTLTVNNAGPTQTSAVRVVDNLPAASDFAYQTATGSGWSCSQSGQQVTCNYTGAAPAINAPYPAITITGRITRASAGTITNIASVSGTDPLILDPVGTNNTSNTVITNIEAGSDLQAIKSMPATITVGSPASIVLTIRNTGPQAVPAGSRISDTIDSSLTIGLLPAGCSASGQTVTCTTGALTATGQANFTIPVNGASATPGIINNTATVTPPAGFADPDFGNNTAIAPFQVVQQNADLELRSKTKSPNPVAPGANVTSTILVRNLGPSVASYSPTNPIRVTDTLSAGETYVSVTGTAWSCGVAGNVVTCATTGTGTLAVGSQLTLTLTTRAGAGVDATITNTACTDRTGGSGHLPSSATSPTGNDCRSAGVRSTTLAADLTVAKDVSLSPTGGWTENLAITDTDAVFYVRLQVSNVTGGDLARTVRVTDALPNFINSGAFVTGVTVQSTTSGTLVYTPSSGLATWSLSNLAGGTTQTMVLRVARPFESGSFTNFASVFSPDTTELNTGNNTDSAQYAVTGIADMTINSKSVTPNPARIGVQSTYIISVRNDGANPADNVVVRDVIDPARFQIVGTPTTTKPGATCSVVVATGTVTCNMGQFTRTEVRQVNVQVLPVFPFGGSTTFPAPHTNQATVTTSTRDSNGGADPVAGNNFFNLNHSLEEPRFDLSITKTESNPATDDPVRFDETLNYDIRVSNFGPSRATDILVTDIPAPPPGLTMTLNNVTINPVAANGGLSLQAAPNAGCAPSGANILCRVDTGSTANNFLNSSSQVIFRLRFTMGGTPPGATVTFANAVEVTSAEQTVWNGPGADTTTANNRAVQNTTVLPSTDLEIVSKTRVGALQRSVNEPVAFTIRFRNNGPSSAASLRITDVLPAGFVYAASPAPGTSIPGGSAATVSGVSCSGTGTIVCDITGSFPPGAANTVDLTVNAKAQAPYSGALAPTDATDTATITPGLDAFGDPLTEDSNASNNSQSAVVQIRPSTIAGSVYADNNDNNAFDGGEGMNGVTLTLTGTDAFGNAVTSTAVTNGSGAFSFGVLPPSNASGYTIVETQPVTHYDLNETAGSVGGTVNNTAYGNGAAQNTISAIVLAASTDATGYIFQNHLRAVIIATNDNPPSVVGAVGQTNLTNAFGNDSFNGGPINPAAIITTIITPASNGGVTMDTATGNVSVAPGTPAGTYTIDYRICDLADPTTCATARVTVVVTAAAISAANDTVGAVNGATGANDVLSALAGDMLNGAPATLSTVTITLAPGATVPAGLSFDIATGLTSVAPNTPAGNYTFNYRICEILNPGNCAIATETVSVVAGPILAVNDSATGINGASGATNVLNVLTGDTRNGAPATTGEVTITLAPGATVPAGLTFNPAAGNVSVNPGTPAGTYFFNYRICEIINPANCSIAEARVTVTAASIASVNDSATGINGADGANNVLNVLTGDTLNGAPASASTVDITVAAGSSVPAGLTFNPATGSVSVNPGTAAGIYSFNYTICEKINPLNCSTSTATVTVGSAAIAAANDSVGGINGANGATNILNALAGDTLNGVPATTSTVTISLAPGATVPAGITFDTATGNSSVLPGTPAGSYSFNYQICEILNSGNCSTATETITVIAAPIAAVDDSVTGINGASGAANVLNVLDGDTLNGAPATASTVIITVAPGFSVPAGLTFDPATGNISVNPGTPAGDYSFDYRICEILNPANCAIATATVTVEAAPITADPDTTAPINGGTGSAGVIDVLPNDTLNGAPAALTTVTITVTAPAAPINGGAVPVLNPATGLVDVLPGTPAGIYTIEYTICEQLNPANCAVTTVTIPVTAGPIAAVDDTVGDINGAEGAANVLNVVTGDTINGTPATTGNVTITVAPGSTVPAGLTFDPATGSVSVQPGTPAGDYSFDYQICEILNPTNCTTATATVTVIPSVIEAIDDTVGDINSAIGGPAVLNVFTGDTINGRPALPSTTTVALAPGTSLPPGITFDPVTGNVGVNPGTPAATYSFEYDLCERLNPTNCSRATVTITVVPPLGAINGIVYLDQNLNRSHEGDEPLQVAWIVNVIRNGEVVATTQTDADGFYSVEDLLSGSGYTIQFVHPTNNVVYGMIENAELPVNGTLADQNLPIDPSGVVYDVITRQPVAGAVATLVDAAGIPLPTICYLDPSQQGQVTGTDGYYRFDIVAGADAACPTTRTEYRIQIIAPDGYANPQSTVIAAESGSLNVAGLGNPAAVVASATAPAAGQPTTYYLGFLIAQGDAHVVNNHIPLDPFLNRTPLLVSKTSAVRTASTGDLVPYTITVRNTEAAARVLVNVVDILPPGFKYVPGSSRVDGAALEPVSNNRELTWTNQNFAGNQTRTYDLIAVIGAGVTEGDRINTAVAREAASGSDISNRAQAVISIVPSAIFDCAEIIGKVFDDLDGDGYQDEGEPGIPGARVATVNGQLITADEYGRYHITCAAVPNAQIGSNFVLKLDTRTIPAGYAPTSDNPQSIRLTRGKISELNFGVQRARLVAIAADARAFGNGSAELKPSFAGQLNGLKAIEAQRLMLQVTYTASPGEQDALVRARLETLRQTLAASFASDWDGPPPTIETNMVRASGVPGRE